MPMRGRIERQGEVMHVHAETLERLDGALPAFAGRLCVTSTNVDGERAGKLPRAAWLYRQVQEQH